VRLELEGASEGLGQPAVLARWLGAAMGPGGCQRPGDRGFGRAQRPQRYAVLGGPVSEVRGLAQREAGPWLDERSAGAAKAPLRSRS